MLDNLRLISYNGTAGPGGRGSGIATAQGVAKLNTVAQPYAVANEYVSGEIARVIGLPVPPSYVAFGTDNSPIFMSMAFTPRGDDLPPVIPGVVATMFPVEAMGTLVFDIFIGNSDRHSGNLVTDNHSRRIAIFDHGHALFGPTPAGGPARLAGLISGSHLGICDYPEPCGLHGTHHCLLDEVSHFAGLTQWVEKIEQLPNYFLTRISEDTVKLGVSLAEAEALSRYLIQRKEMLRDLVQQHQPKFTNIVQWGLI